MVAELAMLPACKFGKGGFGLLWSFPRQAQRSALNMAIDWSKIDKKSLAVLIGLCILFNWLNKKLVPDGIELEVEGQLGEADKVGRTGTPHWGARSTRARRRGRARRRSRTRTRSR